jgi:Dna[CI] antecedent, DciA
MRETKSLSDILAELITIRGYGRLWVQQILENAWNIAIGEPDCHQTRIGDLRRGVLSVTVAHSPLLEELAVFRKGTLLASLQSSALGICDIQFRVGSIGNDIRKTTELSSPRFICPASNDERARSESESRFP